MSSCRLCRHLGQGSSGPVLPDPQHQLHRHHRHGPQVGCQWFCEGWVIRQPRVMRVILTGVRGRLARGARGGRRRPADQAAEAADGEPAPRRGRGRPIIHGRYTRAARAARAARGRGRPRGPRPQPVGEIAVGEPDPDDPPPPADEVVVIGTWKAVTTLGTFSFIN